MTKEHRNLVLTGFMATGKSTIGKIVAEHLDRPFVDSDDEIVFRTGMTIPQLFERYGEEGFRRIETVLCKWLASREGYVIATGGGMLVNLHNLAIMSSNGLVICFVADPEVISQRLQDASNRPLARDWEALYEQRRAAYATIPNKIDTSNKTPEEVTAEVLELWQSSL